MPKKIREYLLKVKMKMKSPSHGPQIRLPSKSWILSACKHPKTPSFAFYGGRNEADDDQNKDDAATLADVDRFLLENFKSLYLKDDKETQDDHHVEEETTPSDETGSVSTINDISSSNSYEKETIDNSIALLTHSTSPYDDFKRSMQEMISNHGSVVDWDFMEELLFSYLNLNHKKSHKFILSAFVDLITVMRRDSDKPRSVRTVRTKNLTLEFGSSKHNNDH